MLHHLLLVEDDVNLSSSLKELLESENFKTTCSRDLKNARKEMKAAPDAVVLDWHLPDGQGIDLLREWRNSGNQTPVLLLTAKSDVVDKVLGLELGADDYLTKPFEPRELLARLRVQLRKSNINNEHVVESGPIRLDFRNKEVSYLGKIVDLTKMEFQLLQLFLENPKQVFSREELLNQVWGYENYPTTRTIDTHVLQLRQKFEPSFFETIRGMGYRYVGGGK